MKKEIVNAWYSKWMIEIAIFCTFTWDRSLAGSHPAQSVSIKPGTFSGRLNSRDDMITNLHWIASSSPFLFLAIASWMLFPQIVRTLSLQLCVVFRLCLGSSIWFILVVLENHDSPPIFGTAMFVIHTLCTECVGRCTWLSSLCMHFSSQDTVSSTMIEVLTSRWLDYNVWSDRCLDWKFQFLVQVCLECPVGCLL